MSDAECPTCGRNDFASEQGMKAHHARSHGESLTTIVVKCEVCGEEVEKDQHELENQEYVYCSQDCHYEHNSERYSGDGNPRSTLETVACANCGDELQRPKWRREREERFFCDFGCMAEARKEQLTGETNPRWAKFETNECEYCGKAYKIKPSLADVQRFCSTKCQNSWQRETFGGPGDPRRKERVTMVCENCQNKFQAEQWEVGQRRYCSFDCMHEHAHPSGEDHPRWNPDSKDLYYGPNWEEQRLKAILRDQARCQAEGCDRTTVDNLQYAGKELTAHHIKSLETFEGEDGNIDYDVANDLENLAAVCSRCHPKVDHGFLQLSQKSWTFVVVFSSEPYERRQ